MLRRRKRKTFIHFARIVSVFVAGLGVAVIIALSQLDINNMKSQIADALQSVSGLPVEINGPVSWNLSLRPEIQLLDVRIKNASWANHKYAVVVPKMLVEINLVSLIRKAPTVQSVRMVEPVVNIEQNEKGELSVQSEGPKIVVPQVAKHQDIPFPIDFGIGSLELDRPQIFLIKIGRVDTFAPDKLKFWIVNRSNTLDYGGFVYDNEGNYPFLVSFAKFNKTKKVYPVHLTIAGDVIPSVSEIELNEGKVPVSITSSGTIGSMKTLSKSLGIYLPEVSRANFEFAASIADKKLVLKKLSIKTKKSDLLFSGLYDFGTELPYVALKLKSNVLDLDEFFPNLYGAYHPEWVRPKRKLNVFKDTPLYGNLMSLLNGKLEVDMGRLDVYRKMSISDIVASIDLKDSLTVIMTDARYMGGNVKTKISARHMKDGDLLAQIGSAGRNVSVGDIFASVNEKDFISDLPVNFDFYLEGHGKDLEELISTTTGPMQIVSAGGGYAFEDLIDILYGRDFLTSLRESTYATFTGKKNNQMRINCAVANLKFRAGRTKLDENVAIQTKAVNVRMIGEVNFGRETMELSINTTPVDGLRLSLSGNIANSMEFRGSLAEPELKFKRDAVVEKLATATGLGIAAGALTGGVGLLVGAGVGLVGGDVLGNWTADELPCRTALLDGAPKAKRGDPVFLNRPVIQTVADFMAANSL